MHHSCIIRKKRSISFNVQSDIDIDYDKDGNYWHRINTHSIESLIYSPKKK